MTHADILSSLCNLPTAPYREGHVIAWLSGWARTHAQKIRLRADPAGNLYLEYRHGIRAPRRPPLVLEAHMDHPGFEILRQQRNGILHALFRGGVKPSHFKNARVRIWLPQPVGSQTPTHIPPVPTRPTPPAGTWLTTRVLSVKRKPKQRDLHVLLAAPKSKPQQKPPPIPPGTIAMWDLPDAASHRHLFAARVCDDLAGLAAIICALDDLIRTRARTHVIALCSRAEEVGFAGVLAACENRWLPARAPVIGLETSRAFPAAPQGDGPIIRVGDRTGIFSAGLTHFISQTAGHIADADSSFKYQRKLMDGGTCNSTACAAYGYDATGVCLALGNYHNMFDPQFSGPHAPAGPPAAKAGPGIASETIHLGDFAGLVRLLVAVAKGIGNYQPGLGEVRRRLAKMHRQEQKKLLYQTLPS